MVKVMPEQQEQAELDLNKQELKRDSLGRWKKGFTGNPLGRKNHKSESEYLRDAINKIGSLRNKPFFEAVAEAAYEDRTVMIAVLKKIVPDLKHITGDVNQELTLVMKQYATQGSWAKERLNGVVRD